jgi:hypothetical protein
MSDALVRAADGDYQRGGQFHHFTDAVACRDGRFVGGRWNFSIGAEDTARVVVSSAKILFDDVNPELVAKRDLDDGRDEDDGGQGAKLSSPAGPLGA